MTYDCEMHIYCSYLIWLYMQLHDITYTKYTIYIVCWRNSWFITYQIMLIILYMNIATDSFSRLLFLYLHAKFGWLYGNWRYMITLFTFIFYTFIVVHYTIWCMFNRKLLPFTSIFNYIFNDYIMHIYILYIHRSTLYNMMYVQQKTFALCKYILGGLMLTNQI